jgi:benzodiazapine receptor
MKRSLILFTALVLVGGIVIGGLTVPDDWYARLVKPSFNPPNWVFGPVWSALYVLIGVAGWRTYEKDPKGWPMKLWWTQLALNFLWSPVFFSAHSIGLALVVVLLLLLCVLAFIAASWRQDRIAAGLFAPYAAWVAFASLLNGAIFALN